MPAPWYRHLTLLRTFALCSALVLVLIAALLSWRLQDVVARIALEQETAQARVQAQLLVGAGLLPPRLATPLTAAQVQHLTRYIQAHLPAGGNVRVKVWDPHGIIRYSDAPAAIGRRFPLEDDLHAVLSGAAPSAADISDLAAPENVTERGYRHLLEVYVPIVAQGHGRARIVGAFELYHNLQALDQQQAALRRTIVLTVAGCCLLLYLALFLIVQRASRRLQQQSAENARLVTEREALYLTTLDAMARTIDARDAYTAGHSQRVAAYAMAIGRMLDLPASALAVLQRGGTLHDIGKIGVPDAVLNKPGRLTVEELAQMQRHPEIGYDLLRDVAFLHEELDLIRHHHERWDGAGYPDQLRGEAIPRGARILGVADAFDAMTSDRPYRAGLPVAEARGRLCAGAGTQFWPPAVGALIAALDTGVVPLPTEPARAAPMERAS